MRARFLRSPLTLIIISQLILAGCGGAKRPDPLTGEHSFSIVYTQSNFGNIEPCSCNNRTRGGFPRRQTLLKSLKKESKGIILVDSGNSLFSENLPNTAMVPQARKKAKAIAEAFVMTGLDAYVFGDRDLMAGGNFFRDLVKETGLPVLAANVINRSNGEPVFQEYKIIDVDGVKIAILGLVGEELRPMVSEENDEGARLIKAAEQPIFLADMFEDRDVKFEDPIAVAKRLVPKLREQAHLVAILSHLPPRLSRDFEQVVPGVDFVIGSHKPSNNVSYAIQGQSLFLTSSMNGTEVGVVDFKVKDGGLLFEDQTMVDRARTILPVLSEWVDGIVANYGTDDPETIMSVDNQTGLRFERLCEKIAEHKAMIERADQSSTSSLHHRSISLDGEYEDDLEMATFVRNYRQSLVSLYAASDTTRAKEIEPIAGIKAYVGTAKCAECHRPQHEFWENTRHAHAWQTMLDEAAEYDLECITCHTVGYMQPGGYDRPDRVSGFENVQCENCHSAGSAHVSGYGFLEDKNIVRRAEGMDCEKCHNSEHSPDFRRQTYVARVSCPPLDPMEPLIRGAFGKARDALSTQLGDGDASPRVYAAHIDLDIRLRRYTGALALAEKGLIRFPGNRALEIGAARALNGLGRSSEALQQLNALYDLDRSHPAVLKEMIELLLTANDASVRDPELAAQFAGWGISEHGKVEVAFHRYFAMALHEQGELDQAISVAKEILQKTDGKEAFTTELLSAWTSERETLRLFATPPPLPVPPTGP